MATQFLSRFTNGASSFSGQMVRRTTPSDQNAFRIPDSVLMNQIERNFRARPTGIFFGDPTPWGDVFQRYNWTPLTTTLVPRSFTLIGQNLTNAVIMTDSFTNNTSREINWHVTLSR